MKVRCVTKRHAELPLTDERHLAYWKWWFGSGPANTLERSGPLVGSICAVHALYMTDGYGLYLLRYPYRSGRDIRFMPAPCFEIVDDRLSSHWKIKERVVDQQDGSQQLKTTLAPPPLLDGTIWLERIIDGYAPDFDTSNELADAMDREAGLPAE